VWFSKGALASQKWAITHGTHLGWGSRKKSERSKWPYLRTQQARQTRDNDL
jgi:hypothetical protein